MTKPIVPVYLNQRIVFDLLAMLDGGLSVVERVQTEERGSRLYLSRDMYSSGVDGNASLQAEE